MFRKSPPRDIELEQKGVTKEEVAAEKRRQAEAEEAERTEIAKKLQIEADARAAAKEAEAKAAKEAEAKLKEKAKVEAKANAQLKDIEVELRILTSDDLIAQSLFHKVSGWKNSDIISRIDEIGVFLASNQRLFAKHDLLSKLQTITDNVSLLQPSIDRYSSFSTLDSDEAESFNKLKGKLKDYEQEYISVILDVMNAIRDKTSSKNADKQLIKEQLQKLKEEPASVRGLTKGS